MPPEVTFMLVVSQNKLPGPPHLAFVSHSLCPSLTHAHIFVFCFLLDWPLASAARRCFYFNWGYRTGSKNVTVCIFPACWLISGHSLDLFLWLFLPSLSILLSPALPAPLPPPPTTAATLNYFVLCQQRAIKSTPSFTNQIIAEHSHSIIHEIRQNLSSERANLPPASTVSPPVCDGGIHHRSYWETLTMRCFSQKGSHIQIYISEGSTKQMSHKCYVVYC